MVKPHRAILDRAGDGPAVLVDTPYGFQENASDISARAVSYFKVSVGRRVDVMSWRTAPPDGIAREQSLAALRAAAWVFAGPGSPTYALRQWRGTPVPELLSGKLARGGVVVFASAAALTVGSHTVPVYEIYKAGLDPYWDRGLDLVKEATGLPVVVIPHYNNAEGGHHDTRYCYLGERRLSGLEQDLPDGSFILGVDEHTACVLDLDARTAEVVGNSTVTVRRKGVSTVIPAPAMLPFDELAAMAYGARSEGLPAPEAVRHAVTDEARNDVVPTSLRAAADRIESAFAIACQARDVAGCVAAILDLEATLAEWSADTLASDDGDYARGLLRSMIVRFGDLASAGAADPRDGVAPYVEALLTVRRRAREHGDYATSDMIREKLVAAGVEVRDTADGTDWDLRLGSSS